MNRVKNILYKLKPRWYVCRDVVMVIWLGYEWLIPRWFKDDRRR